MEFIERAGTFMVNIPRILSFRLISWGISALKKKNRNKYNTKRNKNCHN